MLAALQQQFVAGSKVGMDMGQNTTQISSWGGAFPFANICWNMAPFAQASGSGSWSEDQGVVTASVGTDRFRAYLSDVGVGLPAGTYTVLNPSGANIAIGNFSTPTQYAAWTTATSFTFSYTPGTLLALWIEGSTPMGSGPIEIIKPGLLASWQAGNILDPEYITFHRGLGAKFLRTMDMTNTSSNIETDWSDRTVQSKISFSKRRAGNTNSVVPWEVLFEMANVLDKDLWICVPPRATTNYVTQLAALAASSLNTSRKLYVELGNELWNEADPWGDGTRWIEYLDHTRFTATANFGADTYTLASHGLVNNDPLANFRTRENADSGAAVDWQTRVGSTVYASVVDANTFQLLRTAGGSVIPVAANQVNYLFVKKTEAGKTADLNAHVGEKSLAVWALFEAAMGAARLHKLIPAHAANTNTTSGRVAVAGGSANSVAIAPYFDGMWWGAAADQASAQVTPKVWANINATVHAGVYTAGSTPTTAEVIAGTGSGFISKTSVSHSYSSSAYTSMAALTGLTNGVTYRLCFAIIDTRSALNWQLSMNVVPSASPSTVEVQDSYANQNLRNRLDQLVRGQYINDHAAVSGGLPIIAYESGLHFHENAPTAINTWLRNYLQSADFADALTRCYPQYASRGMEAYCFFSELSTTTFTLVDNYADTADQRYVDFGSKKGRQAESTQLVIADILATDIEVEPSYPTTVHTLPADNTYQILGGDTGSNFDISGNLLRIVNGTGVDWGAPSSKTIDIYGYNANSADRFNVQFALGSSWYPADAQFVWNAVADTDNAEINPTIGGTLTRFSGTGATVASGLWDMLNSNSYTNATETGMASAPPVQQAFLAAMVLDADDEGNTFDTLARIGVGSWFVAMTRNGTANICLQFYRNGPGGALSCGSGLTGKHVYWLYADPDAATKVQVGYDQVNGSTDTTAWTTGANWSRNVYIGGASTAASNAKHGSVVFVSRAGLTLAQAKAIVAKIQTHHGIA